MRDRVSLVVNGSPKKTGHPGQPASSQSFPAKSGGFYRTFSLFGR